LGREREKPANNPLTYSERISIIAQALRDERIGSERFGFVPFPIEHPQKLKQFLSSSVICFTTVCEPWNREKIEVLKKEGYPVEILWEREKKITGSFIREQILNRQTDWKALVPRATLHAVEHLDLFKRLTDLSASR
jgi:nicotinamide mononucleotide adenylyltransferase